MTPVRLVNLTPHPVRLVLPSGRTVELPAAAVPARVCGPVLGGGRLSVGGEAVPLLLDADGSRTVGLPAPRPGVLLVVSRAVACAVPGRADVVAPATGPGEGARRDAAGRVVAVAALKRMHPTRI